MVEIVEYLLVFGVTASLAGFSLLVFGGFLPTIQHTQGQTQVDQMAGAAALAAENGNASLVLPLVNASLTCSQGVFQLSEGGQQYGSSNVGISCDFTVTGLNGICRLTFTRVDTGVTLEVTT